MDCSRHCAYVKDTFVVDTVHTSRTGHFLSHSLIRTLSTNVWVPLHFPSDARDQYRGLHNVCNRKVKSEKATTYLAYMDGPIVLHSDNQPAKHNRNVCWGGGWDPGEGCVGFYLMPGINTGLFAGEGDAMGWDGSIISARYMYKSLAR